MRGFWGIGRLAGIGYCRQLTFKTKAKNENIISRIDWDIEKFKNILSKDSDSIDLATTIKQITKITKEQADPKTSSFFEVQMIDVARHGNDALLNRDIVKEYISQVAPVPFNAQFSFREKIENFLSPYIDISGYKILINGDTNPVCKPHSKKFAISRNQRDIFSEVECFEITQGKDAPTALGWILHHSYSGAIKNSPTISGFRVRKGNIQIGDQRVLSSVFPEERFNGWTVGELHIISPKIMPNGQRNGFEDTPAFRDMKNQLVSKVGKNISKQCRAHSSMRQQLRFKKDQLNRIITKLDILKKDLLSTEKKKDILSGIEEEISTLNQMVFSFIDPSDQENFEKIKKNLNQLKHKNTSNKPSHIGKMSKSHQKFIESIADSVYEDFPDIQTTEQILSLIEHVIKKSKRKKIQKG